MTRSSSNKNFRQKILWSLIPALIGALLGNLYGRFFHTGDPELSRGFSWPVVYGMSGAITALLAARLFWLIRSILEDYKNKS